MHYQSTLEGLQEWLDHTYSWFSSSTSAMDLQTALICGGVFVFSALVVYLISVFGMRERTYEEAMEEQRRRNQEAVQHAKSDKNKKEKKFKKWGKKTKEKVDEDKAQICEAEPKVISEETELKGDTDMNSASSQTVDLKSHVLKKKVRQRKTVILGKDDDCCQPISSSEDTDELPSTSNSPIAKQPSDEDKATTMDKSTGIKDDFKNGSLDSSTELLASFKEKGEMTEIMKPIRKSPTKKNKKTKIEHLEFGSEIRENNENRILNAIKSTSLSEDEVQHIMDALSAKQKNSDKKKNEIAILKKLLQEKEEACRNEQRMHQSANERISDLLQEFNEEKAQASATEKSLRDALNQEQQEIKALHNMMQRKRDQYGTEISTLQSKMQQMKNKMKEEHAAAIQRLQEENNHLQNQKIIETEKQQRESQQRIIEVSRLQHENDQLRSSRDKFEAHQATMQQSQEDLHRQIQQLEKHIEQLLSSHQEEEYSYKQRINEMSNKIQQTENARSSLVQELQNAQSVCSSLEADNSSLRQRLEEAKHQVKNSEQDILKLQSRLEESSRQQRDLGNHLEKMRDEVMDLSKFKHEQLQIIQSLKQENEVLVTQVNQHLSENSEKKNQNGDVPDKSGLMGIEEHEAIIQEKENLLHRLLQELEQCKCEIISLSTELETQSKRNKELSDKKSELTVALHASESKLQEVIKTAELKVQEAQIKVDNNSKEMQNLLNEQIKEELALRESYSHELQSVQQDAENIRKDAEERISKSETDANIRLEEFQESLYVRLNELNSEAELKISDAIKEKEQVKAELENFSISIKDFFQRVFPNLTVPDSIDNKASLTQYECDVRSYLDELRGDRGSHDAKDIENMMKKLEVASKEKMNVESQIKIYQSILAETESVLKNLQNKIENEEEKWKIELHCKDETLKEILNENEELKLENKNLKTNLEQLHELREALYEIEELRLKLRNEESEKKMLLEKMDSMKVNSTVSVPEEDILQVPEMNSNNLPTKSEKRKKSRKRGASGKK